MHLKVSFYLHRILNSLDYNGSKTFLTFLSFHNQKLLFSISRQNKKHKMHLPPLPFCQPWQKKNNRINTYTLVTQNKLEIYKHITKSEIELAVYGHSLFSCTVNLYSPVNAFPYLLPCLQPTMRAMVSVTKIKECNYHL